MMRLIYNAVPFCGPQLQRYTKARLYSKNNLCQEIFWTYTKDCSTDHTGVSPLRQNGTIHLYPKAEILNLQFQSVFTDNQETNLDTIQLYQKCQI